jgi:hypothetical protein
LKGGDIGLEKDKGSSIVTSEFPFSVTARVVTDKGFHILFTLRDTTASGLIAKFDEFQNAILAKGWQPENKSTKESFFSEKSTAEQVLQTNCAICGSPAKRKTGHRKDGSLWEGVFCSTEDKGHTQWLQ